MNDTIKKPLPAWLPFVAGAILVIQFAGLGVWQISRGLGKLDVNRAYENSSSFSNFYNGADVRSYQALKASGRFDSQRQILLDNIIINSRIGFYVLTPLVLAEDEPLLLVNRGWIEKTSVQPDMAALADRTRLNEDKITTVRGRVGSLPKPGMRMGNAMEAGFDWPRIAVYPARADIEAALGQPIHAFVLLMDPDDSDGFLRQWVPSEMGPGKHFAYAFQWFAMGAVLAGLLVWHLRRQGKADE